MKLETHAEITWCPGCTNFGILAALKKTVNELEQEGFDPHKLVVLSGIGCHAKIYDYINLNGFYSIHGRTLPTAMGIVAANPELIPVCFAGDGDQYAEGIAHLVHAARFNANVKLVVHNNQVFALTTGQHTPTTQSGYKSPTMPSGYAEGKINPIAIALVNGATFVAREYALDIAHLSQTLKEAIKHRGFAFIEVLQPCITFNDTRELIAKNSYRLENEGHDPSNFEEALHIALSWNYEPSRRIPLGIIYKGTRKLWEEIHELKPWHKVYPSRSVNLNELWEEFF